MALKADPQARMDEEIFDQGIETKVKELLHTYQSADLILSRAESAEVLEARKRKEKARKGIKDLIPLDGKEHRYRLDGHVITIGTEREGGPVQDRKPSQSIKIEIASEA